MRVGSQAEGGIKVGDIIGVGAQSDSCLSRDGPCDACEVGEENYCTKRVNTYNSLHRNGSQTQGGYALYHRCPSYFVIKIPKGIAPEQAAPMLCGGVTVFSPLKRYNVGPGKRVGVIGVGGLGHCAVLFAKALGADKVVAISRKSDKKQDATQLGATDFIATAEDEDWATKNARTLDVIISTVASPKVRECHALRENRGDWIEAHAMIDASGPVPWPSVTWWDIRSSWCPRGAGFTERICPDSNPSALDWISYWQSWGNQRNV